MEISSFSTPSTPPSKPASGGLRSGAASTGAPSAPAAASTLNLGAVQSIQQAMNNLPNSRADVVARGKALAASSTYPAAEIIDKLAEMFITDAKSALAAD